MGTKWSLQWVKHACILTAFTLAGLACSINPGLQLHEPLPKLIPDESVASDLHLLAKETWDRFLTVFQARAGCFGDVHLHADPNLTSRATYDPDSASITVRVPGTPAILQEALVHEMAHHVEFQCLAHRELQEAMLAAHGLQPDTPWRGNAKWENTPSEQYAEATIELVLGRRQIRTEIQVTPEMINAIKAWAAGTH